MQIVSKAVATIQPGADDGESTNGTFDVILSAQSLDRDGETLRSDEWKSPLPDHITFDIDHGMSVATTVGSGTPFLNDNGDIQVRGTYSSIPRAQEVRTLVGEGHIRTTSVTFVTTKTAKSNDGKAERELLNGSFVPIPSNRDAVVLSSKALDIVTKAGARNSKSDAANIQAIHDASAALGASCDDTDATNADDGEQDGANKATGAVEVPAVDAEVKAASDGTGYEPKPYHADPDETVVCPVCEKRNDDDARYCDQCGTKLAGRDDVKVEPVAVDDKPAAKTVTTYVSKALANSVEDLQARIDDALSNIYERNNPNCWVYVQATFLDDGGKTGTVVYCLNGDSLSRTFTDDGSQVTLGTDVTDVTIITTIVPEGDGVPDSKAAAAVEVKAVDDSAWDGSASRFTIEQWRASCLIGPAESSDSKDDYKLPVKEPNGDVNSNAVHAAAAALAGGRGGVDAPDDEKKAAAKKLISLYGQLKEDPPASILELAGESPKDDTKSADTAAADVKSAAAASADEEMKIRARALQITTQALAA